MSKELRYKSYNLRKARVADLPTMVRLYELFFNEDCDPRDISINRNWPMEYGSSSLEGYLSEQTHAYFLAEIYDYIVGFIGGHIVMETPLHPIIRAELQSIYIVPDYRKSGIGSDLVKYFVAWAKSMDAQTITVSTYFTNETAISFYSKLGFKPHLIQMKANILSIDC